MSTDSGRTEVFAEERQQLIARVLEEHGRARVADLAGRFRVSSVTIRKDLEKLEQHGRLVRTHGGAVAAPRAGAERAFDVRERLQRAEKEAIGRRAAAMVIDGESIALDASTTALALARHLKARGGWQYLTVVTNGLRIAAELAGQPGITVAMPGGFVRREALSLVGAVGEGLFDKVNIHRSFMGAAGFSLDAGLTDATEDEAQIKRLMVAGASEVIGLVDHTKWGRTALATFCRTATLAAVVSDALVPSPMAEAVQRAGIELHLAALDADRADALDDSGPGGPAAW